MVVANYRLNSLDNGMTCTMTQTGQVCVMVFFWQKTPCVWRGNMEAMIVKMFTLYIPKCDWSGVP